jgi:hypothetical protein
MIETSLILGVSSPTKSAQLNSDEFLKLEKSGIVQLFNITNNNGELVQKSITILKSDRPYSGFGSKIKVN